METELYPHKIAAVYPDEATAKQAVQALQDAGLDNIEITTLAPDEEGVSPAAEATEARNKVVLDTLFGTVTGGAAGAVTAGAVAIVAPALFVNAPVVAPLMVLGYGGRHPALKIAIDEARPVTPPSVMFKRSTRRADHAIRFHCLCGHSFDAHPPSEAPKCARS